jgi:hypothetical protein
MAVFRRGLALLAFAVSLLASTLIATPDARAQQPGMCRVVALDFTAGGFAATSTDPDIVPQIVAWLEKPTGEYVATMYITDQVGRYGMGNRPGRFDFNTGPNWPYGRRLTVFPVWSNRNGQSFQQVSFQDGDDGGLSHRADQSSRETHFCRPLQQSEPQWDAASCPSTIYTDKGIFNSRTTGYPPRADVTATGGADSTSVAMYRAMNPFDAVSQASPHLGLPTEVTWPIPQDLPPGDYVVFVEVALERDFNGTYSADRYPGPSKAEINFSGYGVAYRGQPSVVYRIPFTLKDVETTAITVDYVGYGDPGPDLGGDGHTPAFYTPSGTLHPPDGTITVGVPNTGASRLLLTSRESQMFRVRVDARPEPDYVAPGTPGAMQVVDTEASDTTLMFTAPGDDGMVGVVTGYEVRYRVGDEPMTEADFAIASEAKFTGNIVRGGEMQELVISNLLPETPYTVAVRAYDDCHNTSVLSTASFTTAPRKVGQVDACFIATAAYGSLLANDVEMLRRFRDRMLKRSVLGELAVETYYTFGPTVAGVVGESDLLRSTARDLLAPLVHWVRGVH